MSSSPLFASVAESIVIFGPIDHVGCASASSTVTDSSSSADRFRNGPARRREHDRVDRPGHVPVEALEERGMLAVDRKQQPSTPLPRAQREIARGNETLLVRERERHTVLERPQRRPDAREPDDGVEHEVGLGRIE